MTEFEVSGKDQLAAAIRAYAQPTDILAKQYPFTIRLNDTRTVYRFGEGILTLTAERISRNIRKMPVGAFK